MVLAHFSNPRFALHKPDIDSTCQFLSRFIKGPIPRIPASPPSPLAPSPVALSPISKDEKILLFLNDVRRELAQIV